MGRSDELMGELKNLSESHESISAAMIAKRGLEGLMMFPDTFKEDVADVWDPLSKSVNGILEIVSKFGGYGLKRSYIQILGFEVYFKVIADSDTALMVFVKTEVPYGDVNFISACLDESSMRIMASVLPD